MRSSMKPAHYQDFFPTHADFFTEIMNLLTAFYDAISDNFIIHGPFDMFDVMLYACMDVGYLDVAQILLFGIQSVEGVAQPAVKRDNAQYLATYHTDCGGM